METELPTELRAALYDIQRYLLDEIPPLTASEAVETLMTQPPQLLMHLVHGWAIEQSRLQSAAMCDFLFHAIRKIHTVSALNLVDEKALDAYLAGVIPLALQACPVDERETLQTSLSAMRQSHSYAAAPVDLHRAAPLAAPATPPKPSAAPPPAAGPAGGSARRFSLVMERLTNLLRTSMTAPGGGAPAPQARPAAQLVSLAAASSNSEEELKQYIASLRPYTGGASTDNLFGLLATGIAPWDIALPPGEGSKAPSVEAMHKIMTLTRDPMESLRRFRELMATAVEQFNKGALTASVSMLELADTVAVEKKIDPTTVSRIREALVESLSSEQLRKLAENRTRHPLLRKALGAFPSLTTEGLFGQLRGEGRPERRRQLLALLEAWGPGARARAMDELEAELNRLPDEVDTYYLRNLIYLLHRIPREGDASQERELALLTHATDRGQSIYVVKEAILPLGQINTDASVRLLTTRLAEFETLLLKKETSIYPATEMQKTIDRIVVALGRIGTPAALLTVARHGMKPNPLLGDTRARLSALGQHDLSFDEQTVDILIRTIREDLPSTLLGKFLPKRQAPPISLIEALASTRSERVEELFHEIAQKYPDDPTGVAAAAALENLTGGAKRRDTKTPTLTGDLEFFGLPSLLQSLADTAATGIVTLTGRESGQTSGKLLVVNGKFADAQVANLRGAEAVYQLLERPVVGFFAFVPHPAENVPVKGELRDVMGLLLEGIRRHDELNAAATVVPDDQKFAAGGVKPTADPEESDPSLTRQVWLKAISGQPVNSWEGEIPVDAFRVRRLLARWVEEGALQPA